MGIVSGRIAVLGLQGAAVALLISTPAIVCSAGLPDIPAPVVRSQESQAAPPPPAATGNKIQKPQAKRRARRMKQDRFDIMGPLMNQIGQALAAIADGDPEGVFLYVEFAPDWVSPYVYKDEGRFVRNLDADDAELMELLLKAWRAESEDKRWSVMEYDIKDGRFSVAFRYAEEVTVSAFDDRNLRAALRARYGKRPVIYPPVRTAPSS